MDHPDHRLHDGPTTTGPNALQAAWQEVRTPAARYAEAMHLVAQARFVEANNLLMAMPDEKALKPKEENERTRMLYLTGTLASAAGQGRNAYSLTTAEISQLVNLRDNGYDRPGNWAGNLLCAVYGNCLPAHSGGDPNKATSARAVESVPNARTKVTLSAYPNPASTWVAISYSLPSPADGKLVIRDAQGRVLERFAIQDEEGQIVWDSRRAIAGAYTVAAEVEGATLVAIKLIIQP